MIKFKNRRILITGSEGFLGREVVRQLELKCDHVFGADPLKYDLRYNSHVIELIQESQCDTIIHLAAAVGGIGANKANPGKFFYDNMQMGLNIMYQARAFGVSKVVNIGSSCIYPHDLEPPFKESDMWKGFPQEDVASYAMAKKMLLVMGQGYRKQYGLNSIYLIPTNLYGQGDNFDLENGHVVASLIKKFSEGKGVVEVWGSGKASREFLYVEDCARAIIMATEDYDKPDPINIGTGIETDMKTLVEMIRSFTNFKGVVTWNGTKPDGKPRCSLDVSKAWEEFGFKANIHLEEGLLQTIRWYKENYGK